VRGDRLGYDDASDAAVCEYCDRPLPDEELLALHHGTRHFEDLSEDQRKAYQAAATAEQADIRLFRLQALGALILVYFGFLMVYAVI